MKTDKSILPLGLVGIMVPDELLDVQMSGIPTTINFTKKGLQIRRGWWGDRQRIIKCLKLAIARLELEEEAANSVIH